MKCLVILASVVLICQCAKVPEDVTHKVSVALPSSVLAPSTASSKDTIKTEVPAQVVQVAKDHKQPTKMVNHVFTPVTGTENPLLTPTVHPIIQVPQVDPKTVVMTTIQPEMKTVMPSMTELKRKTRAVMTTVQPEVKTVNHTVKVPQVDQKNVVMSTIQPKMKSVMPSMTELKRKTRAATTTVLPQVKPVNHTVKVPQVDQKNVVMSTIQPEIKTVMPSMTELKRKTRAATTTVQPQVKPVNPTVQVPQVDQKNVVMSTIQPKIKTVMPSMTELKRKTRAATTTVEPEVKPVNPTVKVPQVDQKNVVMSTIQPEMKSVMPSMTELKRKTRAATTTVQPQVKPVNPTVQVPPVDQKNVVMSTIQPEMKTVMPLMTDLKRKNRPATTTVQPEVKTMNPTVKVPQVDQKNVVMSTIQPEVKTVMPLITDLKRKTRAATTTVQPEVKTMNPTVKVPKVYQKTTVITTIQPSMASASSTIDPCDLLCTKFVLEPICASNGLCLHEFPNQCILDTFNCRHTKGKFAATKDDSCQMAWLTKCDESEML